MDLVNGLANLQATEILVQGLLIHKPWKSSFYSPTHTAHTHGQPSALAFFHFPVFPPLHCDARGDDDWWKKYARIIVSLLDEFSARSPFSIHKIALLGKQFDKEIGQWFGPSTISQVIR